jgi:hypothetical protein
MPRVAWSAYSLRPYVGSIAWASIRAGLRRGMRLSGVEYAKERRDGKALNLQIRPA